MLDDDDRPIDLMKELGRGAIYRGGEDKEAFLTGYAQGVIAWVILSRPSGSSATSFNRAVERPACVSPQAG